jgi:ribonucleoside-diphosphate reductase alpha chain
MKTKPKFDDNALAILHERYLWKNERGEVIETPQEMLERVARVVASVEKSEVEREKWSELFYESMASLDFLPNSPTLMNAGREGKHGQLSACYVIGIEDSMESIFEALKKQALIHKFGGGTGFNFSALRPENSIVQSTNGKASGPVSFMELFNLATDVVQQGGMRRGANMGILNCDHPDIVKFIKAKTEEGKLHNFNISVAATDEFMTEAVKGNSPIFDLIVEMAWKTGDPGLVFIDEVNRKNPTPHLGKLSATNPCGETPLYPNEACNLGSINLANMVTPSGTVNYEKLGATVRTAVRFLDNVIDVNNYPLPEIRDAVMRTRKIGLGVMGWAEMLFKMLIPYYDNQAFKLAEEVMAFINKEARHYSFYLGIERGSYPAYYKGAMRNATVTCIAPTGTISLLAGCSSGIEPVFALRHKRIAFAENGKEGKTLEYYNPIYLAACDDMSISDELLNAVFVTAHDISPKAHIYTQAAFQRHTDLAVSKTINLPHKATIEDVRGSFILAWMLGCKGVTVYRDGCKNKQVLYSMDESGEISKEVKSVDVCPQCGAELRHQDGCSSCTVCSWSKCSI